MALKDKWKDVGKGFGDAFSNLGRSLANTAKDVFDEENKENQDSLKDSWSKTGKSFGHLGSSIGRAAKGTVDAVDDATKDEDTKTKDEHQDVVEGEVVDSNVILEIEEKKED